MPTPRMDLTSVIIPTCNEGEMLAMTVESVLAAAGHRPFEVVVVDDGSTDGSADRYRGDARPGVRVLEGGGLGVAGARNLGVERARGDQLVFLDAHCTVSPAWLDELAEALAPPDVAIAGPAFTRLGETEPRGAGLSWVDYTLDTQWFEPIEGRGPYEVPLLCGACQAFRTETFHAIGRFEPGFTRWGYEDIEIGLRAWALGYRIVAQPSATVAHHFRESRSYDVDDAGVVYNFLRMIYLHFSPERIDHVLGIIASTVGFEDAMRATAESDVLAVRAALDEARVRDDAWFFTTFLPHLAELPGRARPRRGSAGAPRPAPAHAAFGAR
jgi:GT2 family glycosyltransferase